MTNFFALAALASKGMCVCATPASRHAGKNVLNGSSKSIKLK